MNSHVDDISCQLDVIIEIVLALVEFQYVTSVREGTLYETTGITRVINSERYVLNLIERIK